MENGKKRITIAVDGYSSCGKSTLARMLAARLGYVFVDTGAMYRAVTLYALENGLVNAQGTVDAARLVAQLDRIDLKFQFNPERGSSDIYLNGVNVEEKIRSIAVSRLVSEISQVGPVREKMVEMQQKMGEDKGIVMDGRDIGTVVFPHAEFKLFMTADPKVRAQRRYLELQQKGVSVSMEEIEDNLRQRDFADENRANSPLRKADDAVVLDNSCMTFEEEMDWVMQQLETICRC